MISPKRNDESEPLVKKNKKTNLTGKLLKWIFGLVVLVLILWIAIYIIYTPSTSATNSVPKEAKKTKISLHISSTATTNYDYLRECAPQVKCDPNAKYRSINGSCNNLEIPTWGAAVTPFLRMMDASFSDGYWKLRLQTNGSLLPGPRVVDLHQFLGRELYKVSENNVLLLPFGQLIAHDISGLPNDIPRDINNTILDCCSDDFVRKTYPQCQIIINDPPDDLLYSKHNITCMGVTRSLTARNYSCSSLKPMTFMNINTHFIDASEVYGSNETITKRLRTMTGGRLNFSIGAEGQMFCPFQDISSNNDEQYRDVDIQYDTGDPDNGNQNLGITAMQTLFLRFHNFIAFKFSSLNPHWSDEILFQEARRVVIAVIQRIVYKDFLPIVLGEDYQELYGLNKENIYDPTVNPSLSQELSSAAIRVLHSHIPVQFNFMNKDYKIVQSINITDWLKKPNLLPVDDNFDMLLKGFLETPGRVTQPSYNFFISNYLFSFPNKPPYTGLDLMAIDIVRGRDVGLQPYNSVRQLCGLPLAKDFEDLADLIPIKDIDKLKDLYHSVDDVDLMVGMLLEKLSDGAVVGPTSQCLIADGFYRFKAGDRFFYDVQGQPGSFNSAQLKVIKKITLGHVICAVSNVDYVQKDIFKLINHNIFPTHKLKCDDEFNIDLDSWKEPFNRSEL